MRRVEIDGQPPTVDQLVSIAAFNYGHFTSMQVRGCAVRGLHLHLRRLSEASSELFGATVDDARVRSLIKRALAGAADASVGVMMFASPGASTAPSSPHILVGASDPVPEKPLPAWRLQSTEFVRNLPHLKHSSTIGLTFHQRRAAAAGFDDALFVDEQGNVSEGSSWNIAFWDGARVVWPAADQLEGVTKQLLVTALRRLDVPTVERPVHRREIASFTGAVATNSHRPDQPIGAIDQIELTDNSALVDILRAAWDHVSWDVV